ncbi:MAG: hypothetical protein ABL951_02755 [Alphaproteobacteria bacterium]
MQTLEYKTIGDTSYDNMLTMVIAAQGDGWGIHFLPPYDYRTRHFGAMMKRPTPSHDTPGASEIIESG